MSNKHYDVVIIGGGNAGFGVSQTVHAAGKSIAFIEPAEFGGTCPNRGCTPKKVLVAAAQAMHEIDIAHTHGIEVGKPTLNWNTLINRKNDLIDFIPGAMENTAKKRGDVYKGKATFVSPTTVEVNGIQIDADNFVIATGSMHRPLSIPGSELLITSDDVLSETEQPEEVIFIGGGVVAMEFSHVYARAGTKVTVLEMMPQLLPRIDSDAVAQIQTESERIGIAIKTNVEVQKIEKIEGKLQIHYVHDGKTITAKADRIVNGAGRIANVAELNLQAGNIQHSDIRINVDKNLRSVSNDRVWVAGDALVSSAQLSPVATYEGKIVGSNIVTDQLQTPDYSVLPSAVYTVPAISTVGLTETECQHSEIDYDVRMSDMSGWFSGKFYAETVAWSKILVEKTSRKILGAHIVGHHGEELIHLFALAMRHNITIDELQGDFYAFPTFAADIKSMF